MEDIPDLGYLQTIVFILIIALTFSAFFGIESYYGDTRNVYVKGASDIRWGIDIRGGVEAVFAPENKDGSAITDEMMTAAESVLKLRLVGQNITDYEVYTDNNKTINIVMTDAKGGVAIAVFNPNSFGVKFTPQGASNIICNGSQAGITRISYANGQVDVPAYSAMIFVNDQVLNSAKTN